MTRRPNTPKCAACHRRIPRSETDAVLRRVDGSGASERRRFYHSRCIPKAVAKIQNSGEAWLLTVRHVDAEMN